MWDEMDCTVDTFITLFQILGSKDTLYKIEKEILIAKFRLKSETFEGQVMETVLLLFIVMQSFY